MALEHGLMAHAGIEPDVDDIGFFFEITLMAFRTFQSCRKKSLRRMREPGIRSFFFKELQDLRLGFFDKMNSRAMFAPDDRDRNAPIALTGKAPLRPRLHHGPYSFLAPIGDELYVLVDGSKHALSEVLVVDLHEPLRRCAKENRLFTAPAMRVTMGMILFPEKQSFFT